jgi:carboxyl-terminal processing protease
VPLRNLLILSFSAIFSLVCYETAVRSRYAATISEALSIINENYLERVDDRELFEGAMKGMIDKLDQYSNFIPPAEYSQFQQSLDQEFGGIGIVVELSEENHTISVMSPLVGTPAYRAGIRAGDIIVSIDGNVVADMPLKEAVALMRGKPGSEVKLLVLHEGDSKPVPMSVRREIIPVQSVLGDQRHEDGSWDFTLENHPRVGYIRLNTFGDRTEEELREALLEHGDSFDGLILDLRDNAGGYLDSARAVCDMFIDQGVIVSTRGRDNKLRSEYRATERATVFPQDKPMAVLVNHYSASAAEIVAACLQDHGRAVVVGSRTWGKGTVQNVVPLEGGSSALKLTTASYWRPSNRNIHRLRDDPETGDWGVRPNPGMEIELDDEAAERLARWRRDRDFPHSKQAGSDLPPPESDRENSPADSTAEQGETDQENAVEKLPFDQQLERAVEFIHSELPSEPTRQVTSAR